LPSSSSTPGMPCSTRSTGSRISDSTSSGDAVAHRVLTVIMGRSMSGNSCSGKRARLSPPTNATKTASTTIATGLRVDQFRDSMLNERAAAPASRGVRMLVRVEGGRRGCDEVALEKDGSGAGASGRICHPEERQRRRISAPRHAGTPRRPPPRNDGFSATRVNPRRGNSLNRSASREMEDSRPAARGGEGGVARSASFAPPERRAPASAAMSGWGLSLHQRSRTDTTGKTPPIRRTLATSRA
jgi:hypothetical protein